MIWYLKLEYKSKIKSQNIKKIKEFSKFEKISIITMLIFGIILMISILTEYEYFWIISLLYFLFIVVTGHLSEKNYTKNIDEKVAEYNKKLETLRDILKNDNYKLHSEQKIRELIRQIDIENSDKKTKINKEIITLLLFPICLQLTTLFLTNEIDVKSISIVIAVALLIGILYGMWIMIRPIIDDIKDADRILFIKLKALLEDILLVDFIK